MIPVQQENTTPTTPKTEEEEKKKKRFFLWWWILLLLILLIAVGVIVWALFIRAPKTENTLAPDYAPRQVEQHARVYGGETSKLEQTDGGGAVTLEYTTDVNISLSEKKVYFSVANPYQSNQSMLVQIKIKDEVIALISKDNTMGAYCIDLLMVAKYLERIADHATNIAEWVEYSILGRRPKDGVLPQSEL